MNVLMFGWEFPPQITGGLGTACYGIVKGLSEIKDVAVTLVLPKLHGNENRSFATLLELPGADTESQTDRPQGPAVLRNPYGKNMIDAASDYAKHAAAMPIDFQKFDVIHAHDWLTAMAAATIKKLSGKPMVLHIHSTEYDRAGAFADPRIVAIERRGMNAADQIIAVSNFTRNIIIERYGQDRDKVVTIYNAIEPTSAALPARRASPTKTVTFLGRITHQKGPAYFIEAASKALATQPNLYFVMAGEGDLLPAMKTLTKSLGLCARIHFPGFLQTASVNALLQKTDIYVMPSVSEPFGISALEAIDAGIPAILSKQSGVVELFQHVAKVDYWDVDAIAASIVKIAGDQDHADRLHTNAKTELAALNWNACAEKLKSNYRMLVATSQMRNFARAA